MRDAIQEVLLWQTEYSSKASEAMNRRGELVKREFADELRQLLPELSPLVGVDDLRVQGKDGSGMLGISRGMAEQFGLSPSTAWDMEGWQVRDHCPQYMPYVVAATQYAQTRGIYFGPQ